MKLEEYNQIKDMTYIEYCNYLQNKYGIGLCDYMTHSFNKNQKVTRTSEGLLAHHKAEELVPELAKKEVAMMCPFDFQRKENIVYCDYLEHLFLHVLICKFPSDLPHVEEAGINGVVKFLVPELNDLYSGWETKQAWRKICHDKIKNDKNVYLLILKQFIDCEKGNPRVNSELLCSSYNETYGYWSNEQNKNIYKEILSLFNNILG